MRKALWIGAALVSLLAAGAAALLVVDFDSPELGRRVLAAAGEKAGAEITAESFHFNLWRGLRLDGVHLATAGPSGKLTIAAAGLLAEHRLAPLLRGKIEIDRVVLYTPRIELVTPPTPTSNARRRPLPASPAALPVAAVSAASAATAVAAVPDTAGTGAGGNVALRVDRISLRDGTLATRTEGLAAPDVEIRGLDVELRDLALDAAAPSTVQAFSATGDLKTREIVVGALKAVAGSGVIVLAGGHFRLEKFGLELPQGPFLLAEFDADLNQDPFAYRFDCQLDPLNTDAVLATGTATGFGPGRLAFRATGTGTETRDLTGDGTLAIAAGKVPGAPLFLAIETLLGRSELAGAAYEPFSVAFHVRDDRVSFEPFELRTAVLALGLRGWADLAGPVDLRIAVKAPREVVSLARVPPRVLDALAASSGDGMVSLPLRVTGTADHPRVNADMEALGEMGKSVLRQEIEHQAERAFGRLLGKVFGRR
jgi:hypothetical protein